MARCSSVRAGGEDPISFVYETEIVTYRTFSLLSFQPKNKLSPDQLSFPRSKSVCVSLSDDG